MGRHMSFCVLGAGTLALYLYGLNPNESSHNNVIRVPCSPKIIDTPNLIPNRIELGALIPQGNPEYINFTWGTSYSY